MGASAKERHTLYLKFPKKIIDEQEVFELHPNIKAVHLPRQKSRRWCTVDFENKEKLEEVKKALRQLRIEGKRIQVKPFRIPNKTAKKPIKETEDLKDLLDLIN